jgi:hypothetical protein
MISVAKLVLGFSSSSKEGIKPNHPIEIKVNIIITPPQKAKKSTQIHLRNVETGAFVLGVFFEDMIYFF